MDSVIWTFLTRSARHSTNPPSTMTVLADQRSPEVQFGATLKRGGGAGVKARVEDNRNNSPEVRAAALAQRTAAPAKTAPKPSATQAHARATSDAAMAPLLPGAQRTPVQPVKAAPPAVRQPSTMVGGGPASGGTRWEGEARADDSGPRNPVTTYTKDGQTMAKDFTAKPLTVGPAPAAAPATPSVIPPVSPAAGGSPTFNFHFTPTGSTPPAAAQTPTPAAPAAPQMPDSTEPIATTPTAPQTPPNAAAGPVSAAPATKPSGPSFFGTDRDNAKNQERVKQAMSGAAGAASSVIGKVASRLNPSNYQGPTKGSDAVFSYRPPKPRSLASSMGLAAQPNQRLLGTPLRPNEHGPATP